MRDVWVVQTLAAAEDDSSNNNSAESKLYSVDLTVREGSARLFADVMFCRLEEQDGPGEEGHGDTTLPNFLLSCITTRLSNNTDGTGRR